MLMSLCRVDLGCADQKDIVYNCNYGCLSAQNYSFYIFKHLKCNCNRFRGLLGERFIGLMLARKIAPSIATWRVLKPFKCHRVTCGWTTKVCTRCHGAKIDNRELFVGDALILLSFAVNKQIDALILAPTFPGWFAPLHFNPERFLEFTAFAATLVGTWLATGAVIGAYKFDATSDIPTALVRTCLTWLIAMPVAAAQLVLSTASEGHMLVADDGWARRLPLVASGPGEPFTCAAAVLGLMVVWRAYYASYLDYANFLKSSSTSRVDREQDAKHFKDSLKASVALAICGCLVIYVLRYLVGEDRLEYWFSNVLFK